MQRREAHLNFLDTIRGVAVSGIFLAHCHGEAFGWNIDPLHCSLAALLTLPVALGGVSVSVFFAVSGFCIHLSHSRSSRPGWQTFFTRRFFRIYPPYVAAILLLCFLFREHLLTTGEVINHEQVISHLLLVHNLWPSTIFGINGSFWNLAIEVQLYLIYPLLFAMARGLGWTRALVITAAIELGIRSWAVFCLVIHAAPPPTFILQSPFAYWFSWATGAAVAEAFLNGQPLPFARIPVWLFPAGVIISGAINFLQPFIFPCTSLATAVIFTRLLRAPVNTPTARVSWFTRHLRFAGIISYSIYLLHQPFVYAIADRLRHTRIGGDPLLVFLGTAAIWVPILFLAWLFYRLLERPSIALGKWVIGKFPKPMPATPIPAV